MRHSAAIASRIIQSTNLIFGVADLQDPAAAAVRQPDDGIPRTRHPVLQCSPGQGPTAKSPPCRRCSHTHVIRIWWSTIATSRSRRTICEKSCVPCRIRRVGIVTALYCAVAGKTFGSKMEAIRISTEFMGGVLSAREIEKGLHFALGSTLAFPRSVLDKIGGFTPLLDYLADDYELGARISTPAMKLRWPGAWSKPTSLIILSTNSGNISCAGGAR